MLLQYDLTDCMAWQIIRKLELKNTQRNVVKYVGGAMSIIWRPNNHFQEMGNVRHQPGQCCSHVTTATNDWYLMLQLLKTEHTKLFSCKESFFWKQYSICQVKQSKTDFIRLVFIHEGQQHAPIWLCHTMISWEFGLLNIGIQCNVIRIKCISLTNFVWSGMFNMFWYRWKWLLKIIPYLYKKDHSIALVDRWYRFELVYIQLVGNMLEIETIQYMKWSACSSDLNWMSMSGTHLDSALQLNLL